MARQEMKRPSSISRAPTTVHYSVLIYSLLFWAVLWDLNFPVLPEHAPFILDPRAGAPPYMYIAYSV